MRDPALLRPLEQKVKIGDPSKLRALDWAPVHTLDETLAGVLAYWAFLACRNVIYFGRKGEAHIEEFPRPVNT